MRAKEPSLDLIEPQAAPFSLPRSSDVRAWQVLEKCEAMKSFLCRYVDDKVQAHVCRMDPERADAIHGYFATAEAESTTRIPLASIALSRIATRSAPVKYR